MAEDEASEKASSAGKVSRVEKMSLISSKRAITLDTTTSISMRSSSQKNENLAQSKPQSVVSSRSRSSKKSTDEKQFEKRPSVEIVPSPTHSKKDKMETSRTWSTISEEKKGSLKSSNRDSK